MADHTVRMQYADDGQENFGNWIDQSIGATGEYATRIIYTRLGAYRQRVYRFQISSPRKRDILALTGMVAPCNG